MHRLSYELARQVGLKVDLLPVWRERLPFVAPKLFWLDVRLGARVIWGDAHALDSLPPHAPAELPRREAARLLGNRAVGLLEALPGRDGDEDLRARDLHAAKAVLAAMDANLIGRGRYAARMLDRLSLTRGHPHHETFARAVEWKLGRNPPLPDDWWDEATRVLLDAVDETDARRERDGLMEHAFHLARARRLRAHPSRRVREVAWDLLAVSRWPDGPAHDAATRALERLGDPGATASPADWPAFMTRFFSIRSRTLQ